MCFMAFGGVKLFFIPGFPLGASGTPVPPGTIPTSPPGVAPGPAISVPVIPAPSKKWKEVHQVIFMFHYLIKGHDKRQVNAVF